MQLTQIVEALLFASDAPLTAEDLARADERLDEDSVSAVIAELRMEYDRQERAFQIYEVAGGYQMLTRPDFAGVLDRFHSVPQTARLSMPALEVLAIIAYRQPIGRLEIEDIRGVQSSAVLRTLQDRALIEPVGRGESLGRPLLYGTTTKFLEHFGFHSLEDLPQPEELPVVLRPRAREEAQPVAAAQAAAEPTPLSLEAEAEAEALHLPVHPAREHPHPDGATVGPRPGTADTSRDAADLTPDESIGSWDRRGPDRDESAPEVALAAAGRDRLDQPATEQDLAHRGSAAVALEEPPQVGPLPGSEGRLPDPGE
jgi:segregation and condensation protein B